MKNEIVALISGIIFAIGLCVSGMINPEVVINFLDVTGQWDASLAFVMAGALTITIILFPVILKQSKPVCSKEFSVSSSKNLDKQLILGAVLFGIGWGLAGICPGPAVSALAFGLPKSFVFAVSMFVGMGMYRLIQEN